MRRLLPATLASALAVALLTAAASAQEPVEPLAAPGTTDAVPAPEQAADADRHPDLVRLSPKEEVWIDRKRKEVVVGGKIALDRGPIEVFACPAGTKDHEAVVSTKSSARLVHAGLLVLGLDPGRPASFVPTFRPAKGPAVELRLRWRDAEGRDQERPARELIRNHDTGKELDTDWVFVGSQFWRDPESGRELYQADGGDLVCVSNFPEAMLDLPIESSPENGNLLFEAFEGRVPPSGTAVDLVFSAKR